MRRGPGRYAGRPKINQVFTEPVDHNQRLSPHRLQTCRTELGLALCCEPRGGHRDMPVGLLLVRRQQLVEALRIHNAYFDRLLRYCRQIEEEQAALAASLIAGRPESGDA